MGVIKGCRRRWRSPEEPLGWGEAKGPHFEKEKRPKDCSGMINSASGQM